MYEVAVVILNYMNYQETIKCVDSVLMQTNIGFQIVVVDNGSMNESYKMLVQRYSRNCLVHVIRARKNYGFAKGNNIGIKYARDRFQSEFVLLINSDTILIDEQYISILVSKYQKGVGVIGSEMVLRNGKKQKEYLQYISFPETLIQYLEILNQLYGIQICPAFFEKKVSKKERVRILHGSAFMLTPDYFKMYDGLYSKTFLYGEEELLYILCVRADLRQIYTLDTKIYHKEDQSSLYLFQNRNTVKLKYVIKSYKYIVWESFRSYMQNKSLIRRNGYEKKSS